MKTWIDDLLEATKEAETPRRYIYWAGISSIAAVVAPNVYMNRGGVYKLSPNTFVMLIGESGLGKGLPIWLAKKLVGLTKATRVISGRNTIQAIIRDLGQNKTDEKGQVPLFKDSRGFLVSGEFATLLQQDKQALTIITELYDTHYSDDWENKTKSSGIDKLNAVNLTLFGGSTQEHFNAVVPVSDVRGGFVGRILMVNEEERWKINPLSDTSEAATIDLGTLADHLKNLAKVNGAIHWFDKAAIDEWESLYTGIKGKKYHDPTGATNRLTDNILKVAICISFSKGTDLVVRKDDLEEAFAKCTELVVDTGKIIGNKGSNQLGDQTKLIMRTLVNEPDNKILASKLLRRYYGEFDAMELDRILHTLETAQLVTTEPAGTDKLIIMPMTTLSALKRLSEK